MAITRAQIAKQLLADGGRIGFRIGSGSGKDTSGRDYGASTAAAASVASSPSRDSGGGSNQQVRGSKSSKLKDAFKQIAPFVIGGPFGLLSKNEKARKTFDIIKAVRGLGDVTFPEGDLQKIKAI